ncbi:MAG: hypothetical protein ABII22_00940 [Candidatus Micrarchaeota archaeon]
MIIQNYFPDQIPFYFSDFEIYTDHSPFILITGEPDAPIPIPSNWEQVLSSLAELGLRKIHLFGYEAQTVPFEMWEIFYSRRLDNPHHKRIYETMHKLFLEKPEVKEEPVLMIGCVLGAYIELLAARKQFGCDIVLEHELLNPGFDEQNVAIWAQILAK